MINNNCKMSNAVAVWRSAKPDARTDKEILEILENDCAYTASLLIGTFVREHATPPANISNDVWDKHLSFVTQELEEKIQAAYENAHEKLAYPCMVEARTAIVTSLVEAIWNAF